MASKLLSKAGRFGLLLVPLAFLSAFYLYPLGAIFSLSLAPEGELELSALGKLVGTGYYLRTLGFTVYQAALSTLLTVLLALPGAYLIGRYRFPGRRMLMALATIPFVLPTVVVATAFNALLGPNGLVNSALMELFAFSSPPIRLHFTLTIILMAHVFYNYAVVLRIVGGFWSGLGPRLEEAARVLGAGRWRAFREVTLPLLMPALTAAAALVFIFCFTSFGVILILGGPRYATLEVEIYRHAVHLFNLPVAAALSLAQILFTLVVMIFYTRMQARLSRPLEWRRAESVLRRPASLGERLFVAANAGGMLLFLGSPMLALTLRSLTLGGEPSLRYYAELFVNRTGSILYVPPMSAVMTSLGYALATILMALVVGLMSASVVRRKGSWEAALLDPVLMLPLATSAVTLGFGFIISLAGPPLNIRGSWLLVPIAHTLVAFPFVLRSLLPVLRGINPNLREAAAVLGAVPLRVWREIDLPIVARALLVGAVFAFTVSMGEFGASVFVASLQKPTMPVAIYRFLGQPGLLNYGQALAMSTLLMVVCGLGVLVIERFRVGNVGEF